MVKLTHLVFWLLVAGPVVGQVAPNPASADPASPETTGPVLYGDGGGRLWKWEAGARSWLTSEGPHLVLGGVATDQLWGWSIEGDVARFFTLELPRKGAGTHDSSQEAHLDAPPSPVFDDQPYPAPDKADRVGDRLLLLYGAHDGHPRYELWQGDLQLASRAWDDGRTVYGLALGPESGWMVAGRTGEGLPWLEVSGNPVPGPVGWRGRLTVVAWVAEKEEKSPKQDKQAGKLPLNAAKPQLPVHPRAAGWGAPGAEAPRPLFWGPEGWTQPDPRGDSETAGTYPVLGGAGEGTLVLAGWQADGGTGALRPWFWDGEAKVPGGTADGQPQAFSAGGKTGPVLVVAHQAAPWFTLEDGQTSVPLEGLNQGDRVVAIEAQDKKTSP